jgi:hypothetical protein
LTRDCAGRAVEELDFFALFGYWPEAMKGELPNRKEFMVRGVRVVITAERV